MSASTVSTYISLKTQSAELIFLFHTYISPASNLFCKFSLMASLDTLLIKVRSETPTSFFFVASNWALRIFGLLLPVAAAAAPLRGASAALSPFGRRLMPCETVRTCAATEVVAGEAYHRVISVDCCTRSLNAPTSSLGPGAIAEGWLFN